jgi:hypothetical protein
MLGVDMQQNRWILEAGDTMLFDDARLQDESQSVQKLDFLHYSRVPRQSVHKSMRAVDTLDCCPACNYAHATISRDLPARRPGLEVFQTHQTTLHIVK